VWPVIDLATLRGVPAFCAELSQHYLVDQFRTADELAAKVTTAIVHWQTRRRPDRFKT
jgi:hypothetical protein